MPRATYRFTCVGQYAIHEVGHAIGFKHEWIHSSKPDSYKEGNEDIIEPSETSSIVCNESVDCTNCQLEEYNWDSIIVYDDGYVHQTGERLGSKPQSKHKNGPSGTFSTTASRKRCWRLVEFHE